MKKDRREYFKQRRLRLKEESSELERLLRWLKENNLRDDAVIDLYRRHPFLIPSATWRCFREGFNWQSTT